MIKEQLIELLKSYKENIAKLKLRKLEKKKCEKRLKQYKRLESNTTATVGTNCDIHSKNKISNKTEEDIGNNLYFKLFNQTREVRAIKTIVENATNKILNL